MFWLQVCSQRTLLCHWVNGHHFWLGKKPHILLEVELSKLIFQVLIEVV